MPTMTAAVTREQGKPLTLEQVELDDIRPDEARVRMVATGICHTDAIVRDGVYRRRCPPSSGMRWQTSSKWSSRT
jgi:aryl-alcohol dehydrogenase